MSEVQILVVDDEGELLEQLKFVASKTGGQVFAAASAAEALRLIDEKDFDLIITDLRMEKDEAGMDVIERAREKDLWTQVILVTAYKVGPEAITKGAYDYILRTAPGNYLQRLQRLIPEALEYRQQRQKEEIDRKVGTC